MKRFAQVMGLLFGSAWAHTYPKSGQVAPLPSLELSLIQRKYFFAKEYLVSEKGFLSNGAYHLNQTIDFQDK